MSPHRLPPNAKPPYVNFLETLPLGNQLLAAQIGDRLFHVEGVANYVLLSPAEDVLLSADVKLIPGTIQVAPMQ